MVEERPNWRTGKICYIEIPAMDVARSAEFYRQAFGWKMRHRGDGSTSFDDAVGEVSGTFVLGRPPATEPGFGIYIMVADAEATLAAVQAAGGDIVRPVDPAAGEVFAWFKDPGGNTLGVYQQPGLAQTEAAADQQAQNSALQASALQASALQASAREASAREASAREASAREASAREASASEASAPEASAPGVDTADLGRILDLATPWCLHVAATLRIPEHISAGRTGIAELAAAAGCDRDALHAVLGHLVSKGVFTEESPGQFACNRAAEQLAESSFLDLDGIGGRMAHTWGTLLDYVRTGQPAYQQVFGRPFWEDLAAHPQIAAEFDALMGPAGHGIPDFDVELSDGWDNVRTVIDVGGGTGALLASLLRRHPQAEGILVDLPGTVARAGDVIDSFGVSARMTVKAQSFFDPLPAGADLYLLKNVLNDWADEPTVAILRRCAEAARPDGAVAILGGVSADETLRSLGIDMLVAGGKTSTLTQFTELARQAGIEIVAAHTQSSGRFVVEGRPAGPESHKEET
jgi:2,7-dihydroxy-5-methyl-1-naphthoate 7-O-methyltransferase